MSKLDLQTLEQIQANLNAGKKPATIQELINSLSFQVENDDNVWYSSSSLFFIGKGVDGEYTIIATPASLVTGFENYPIVPEFNQNKVNDRKYTKSEINGPSQTEKHPIRITREEFLRLASLEGVSSLVLADFCKDLEGSVDLFGGKVYADLVVNKLFSLLCTTAAVEFADKMALINSNIRDSFLIELPSDGLIFSLVNNLTCGKVEIENATSVYLDSFAVGNEYGLSMIVKTFQEGCSSYQIRIETAEDNYYRYQFV